MTQTPSPSSTPPPADGAPIPVGRDGTRLAVLGATAAGRGLARDLAAHLDATRLDGPPAEAVADAWGRVDGLVLVLATGAATRLVAPHLADKREDPGVVCVDEAGRFAVALTGGHEGGANALAERVAAYLGARAVITTATEVADAPALALLERAGLRLEGDLARVGGALVSGEPVHLLRETPWPLAPLPGTVEGADVATGPVIRITDRAVTPEGGGDPRGVVLARPPSIVVGVGASRGVAEDEVARLVDTALAEAGVSRRAVALLATADVKADEAGIVALAKRRAWPLVTLPAEQLADIEVPNPSEVVAAEVGTPSVAEAAALHLGGELLVTKRRSAMATAAVARRPLRGRLALVSLGPGADDLTTPRAGAELARAEVVVGYGPYVDQAERWTTRGAELVRFGLGEEVDRARYALDRARRGLAVAMVGSGDVGVYAMASPTLEITGDDVEVVVVPGVTASLAASALLGAPLGHDHLLLSLSDLLTPWELIRARLEAAAEADVVLAIYNPRSRGRDWQLDEARRILLAHRPGTTPVGIVRDAERPGQAVTLTTLADLDVEQVQMTTLVVIGSSRSRVVAGRMVTPRGYVAPAGTEVAS